MTGSFIRKAVKDDIDTIKKIADAHRKELGFVHLAALRRSIGNDSVFVVLDKEGLIVGFAEYYIRKSDDIVSLYHIAVEPKKQGLGKELVGAISMEAMANAKKFIKAKCPIDLEANNFYKFMHFKRVEVESKEGRRDLNLWMLDLESPSDIEVTNVSNF